MRQKGLTLIVRRGALRRFDRLKRGTDGLSVDVIWDRRQRDRNPADRREPAADAGDRRKAAPFTWEMADFVVVENEDEKK